MRDRIRNILSAMAVGTYEREEVLALSLLNALSGESIFLLGLPGVGKSMVARRLKLAFKDATVFEYLMSRFSTPDEIFGPISISKLKDADSYERVTTGYLPEAEVVFLDEIWKAGPAIQNTLLTVLNEKIFLNGSNEMHLPIKGIISASNELPAEGEGLEALWDRFLMRYIVEPLKQKSSFIKLINPEKQGAEQPKLQPIDNAEYESIQKGIVGVHIPQNILEIICSVRERLMQKATAGKNKEDDKEDNEIPPEKFYISDRRWKKSIGVLRASAYLNSRDRLNYSDLLLLKHMLWNDESTISLVEYIVVEEVMKSLFKELLDQFKSYKRHATRESTDKRLFSPDREHYVVLCDGGHLNLKIADYNKLKNATQIFFGSEMSDGSIRVRERGTFSIQVVKEGYVSINGYNYPLRTNADKQLSEDFLQDFGGSLESIANGIYREVDENLFLAGAESRNLIFQFVNTYKKRIEDS